MDTFIQYGLAAAIEAVKDSGIVATEENAERIGVSIGSGIGGMQLIEDTDILYQASGPRKISPFFIPGTIINMISGNLSIIFGFKGPNVAIVTACTTGTHSIGDASRMIEYGDADVPKQNPSPHKPSCQRVYSIFYLKIECVHYNLN